MTNSNIPCVRVVYTHYPHYRQPVFDALSRCERFHFEFHYDPAGIERTILSAGSISPHHHRIATRCIGPVMWQSGALQLALRDHASAFIFLGNPFIISTWLAAIIARLRGIRVIFWTHGWVRDEHGVKDWLRKLFYRLAHGLLLYGDRARRLAIDRGFNPEMLHVIGNSLNYDEQARVRERLMSSPRSVSERLSDKPYFLVVARLVDSAGIDLAIEAMARMDSSACLIVIGDGPSRAKLQGLARANGVDVRFEGPMYSEEELAPYFFNCVAVVSPGKVGLLAMHALAYGAAVITHNDPDRQMPEFEAIENGVTGLFFEYGNACDLASTLQAALDQPFTATSAERRRKAAISAIEKGYTPKRQVELIEAALLNFGVGANG